MPLPSVLLTFTGVPQIAGSNAPKKQKSREVF